MFAREEFQCFGVLELAQAADEALLQRLQATGLGSDQPPVGGWVAVWVHFWGLVFCVCVLLGLGIGVLFGLLHVFSGVLFCGLSHCLSRP